MSSKVEDLAFKIEDFYSNNDSVVIVFDEDYEVIYLITEDFEVWQKLCGGDYALSDTLSANNDCELILSEDLPEDVYDDMFFG